MKKLYPSLTFDLRAAISYAILFDFDDSTHLADPGDNLIFFLPH
jgi:hypothetical protein